METLDYDHTIFTKQFAGDESLFVVFYMGVQQDTEATTTQGRPIFKDVEFVRIVVPGDKNNINDRPASAQDKQRFAKQYDKFKAGLTEDQQIVGTRLKEWPLLSRAQVEEFNYLGIKTVEQLAEARDDVISRVPGMRDLKKTAEYWLGKSKATADAAKTAAREKEAQTRIETLELAVKEQAARIEALLSANNART